MPARTRPTPAVALAQLGACSSGSTSVATQLPLSRRTAGRVRQRQRKRRFQGVTTSVNTIQNFMDLTLLSAQLASSPANAKFNRPYHRKVCSIYFIQESKNMRQLQRCGWAKSEIMVRYHDEEWGVPLHDDAMLFEFLCLEGAQAGLSWETILKKRENYRNAFDGFRAEIIVKYSQKKIAALLADSGIVRNRMKIASVIQNARAFLSVQKDFGSFDEYIWQFAPKKASKAPRDTGDLLARSDDSDRMSRDLRSRGFGFVGSTICYAFMQAVGIVNDHSQKCFRRTQVGASI